MTDFDKQLVEKADKLSCWDYRIVDHLIDLADTVEGRQALKLIRWSLYDLAMESL